MNANAKLLREQPSFSELPSRVLNHLGAHASVLRVPKGTAVYHEGDPGDALYVVISGRCQSVVSHPNGREQVLEGYGPGASFGERALMAGDRHWTSVRAVSDAVLLRLEALDVEAALDRSPLLARHLAHRLNEQFDRWHAPAHRRAASRPHSKVTALVSITEDVHGEEITGHVAAAVREITGSPVLLVQLVPGEGTPALADGLPRGRNPERPYLFERETSADANGYRILRLYARGEPREQEQVSLLIGHFSAHFHHVLIHLPHDVPSATALEFVLQSDESFVLLRQRTDSIYRASLLLRQIDGAPAGALMNITPVVCLFNDESGNARDTLTGQLGTNDHAFIHALPRHGGTATILRDPHNRYGAHIKRLARQIGGCRVGLALSSGGAKSLAHIGIIEVLEENGIEVDAVAGASMGGLIAALWACGLSGKRIEELAMRLEKPFGLTRLIDPAFPPRRGFMKAETVRRLVQDATGNAAFSDTIRELRIVATDVDTLERVVFDSGEIGFAVQASMAMPGVVVPVQRNGQMLVDGGASDPLPVGVLQDMGVDRIIAANTVPNPDDLRACMIITRESPPKPRRGLRFPAFLDRHFNYFHAGNILDTLVRSMMGQEMRVAEMACSQADVVLRAVSCDGKWHDFRNASRYIKLGRETASAHLDELKAIMRSAA